LCTLHCGQLVYSKHGAMRDISTLSHRPNSEIRGSEINLMKGHSSEWPRVECEADPKEMSEVASEQARTQVRREWIRVPHATGRSA